MCASRHGPQRRETTGKLANVRGGKEKTNINKKGGSPRKMAHWNREGSRVTFGTLGLRASLCVRDGGAASSPRALCCERRERTAQPHPFFFSFSRVRGPRQRAVGRSEEGGKGRATKAIKLTVIDRCARETPAPAEMPPCGNVGAHHLTLTKQRGARYSGSLD